MSDQVNKLLAALDKWKYPLIIFLVGIMLMLLPTADRQEEQQTPDAQNALEQMLSAVQGVGEARVLISDSGVVVACTGASSASVRLDIIRAVISYTGFGSDKITILKLRS